MLVFVKKKIRMIQLLKICQNFLRFLKFFKLFMSFKINISRAPHLKWFQTHKNIDDLKWENYFKHFKCLEIFSFWVKNSFSLIFCELKKIVLNFQLICWVSFLWNDLIQAKNLQRWINRQINYLKKFFIF